MGRKWPKTMFTFTSVFIITVLFRVFIIEIYSIPSSSMEETILPGDKVLVNKMVFGPKPPASPYDIPWVNLVWFLQAGAAANPDSIYWNYRRLPGLSAIKRDDVIIFTHPLWGGRNNFFIKRCIALPNDTIEIENAKVKINGKITTEPVGAKRMYRVWTNNLKELTNFTDKLGVRMHELYYMQHYKEPVELLLTEAQKYSLVVMNLADSLSIKICINDSTNWVFPEDQQFSWTIDNYGPLVVPSKGMVLELNLRNFMLYGRTINQLEKAGLKFRDNDFYIGGNSVTQYVFKQNYYFMIGDNRHNSNDSRYWGFVPEKNITGRADFILFNFHSGKFTWNRLFKKIN